MNDKDAGRCPFSPLDFGVWIMDSLHIDHVGRLAHLASRRLLQRVVRGGRAVREKPCVLLLFYGAHITCKLYKLV